MKSSNFPNGQRFFYFQGFDDSEYSSAETVAQIIVEKFKANLDASVADILCDNYCIIAHIANCSLGIDWNYAMGLTIRAENKESEEKLEEVAKHVYAELVKKGMVNSLAT